MICTTVRQGKDCPFMTKSGCSYNGGFCHEIVDECKGCNRNIQISSGWYCTACPEPAVKWRIGNCNLASHVTSAAATVQAKVNPLKASKRSSKRK